MKMLHHEKTYELKKLTKAMKKVQDAKRFQHILGVLQRPWQCVMVRILKRHRLQDYCMIAQNVSLMKRIYPSVKNIIFR